MELKAYSLAIATILIVYLVTSYIVAWYPLRKFKGPFLAKFSYLWILRANLTGRNWQIYLNASNKYSGPLFRIGPDLLMTDDAGIMRHINSARTGFTKSDWYHGVRLDPYEQSMLSSTDNAFHDKRKALTASGYSGRELPSMEANVDEQIAALKRLIWRKYISTPGDTRLLDLSTLIRYFTPDVTGKAAFGKEFGFLEAELDLYDLHHTLRDL